MRNRKLNDPIRCLTTCLVVAAAGFINVGTVMASPKKSPSPVKQALPKFGCGDQSYANAKKDGLTLGLINIPPYTSTSDSSSGARYSGIDWDIWQAVIKYLNLDHVNYKMEPSWGSMVPALTSKRIDVIAGNFHASKARVEKISFTSPAYWYGPAIVVRQSDDLKIDSFSDLAKHGYSVGAIGGSNNALYLNSIGANLVSYKSPDQELASLAHGHDDAVLEDAPVAAAFINKRPNAGLKVLPISFPKSQVVKYGVGYARYGVRKGDCTLNSAISRALSELRANGTISSILEKHGLDNNLLIPYVRNN